MMMSSHAALLIVFATGFALVAPPVARRARAAEDRAVAAPAAPAAPDKEFQAVQQAFEKESPGKDLIDRLYDFMERYPHDSRGDRVQYWVGITCQRRKFHNEAVKELGYVVSEFPKSPLVLPALAAEVESWRAMNRPDKVAECYREAIARKPADFKADAQGAEVFRQAAVWLAQRQAEAKNVDGAVALLLQLPDPGEAVQRVVGVYLEAGRVDDAIGAVRRLPDSERLTGYRLMARAYASRPGINNLLALLDEVLAKEKPGDATDDVVRYVAAATADHGGPDGRRKALDAVAARSERLRRWAQYGLCEMGHDKDLDRLTRFIADWASGADVEQARLWVGEYYEAAGDADKAREAYARLAEKPTGHFRIAETWYGPRARKPDLPRGEAELTEIVKRFYSPSTSAEALLRRADLEAGTMKQVPRALDTLRELLDRFPKEGEYPPAALWRAAEWLRPLKRQDEAIESYRQIVTRYPDSGLVRRAWLEIAACYEEKGDPRQAVETFRSVIRKFPRTAEASAAHTRLEVKYNVTDAEVSD